MRSRLNMPQTKKQRTLGALTTISALLMSSTLYGQAANEYDANANGSFTDPGNWSQGGPPWPDENVDGDIEFNVIADGDITVNGIDLNYTGITDLITTDNGETSQLRLEGTGSLHFSNPTGTVTITPGSGLTLAIDTYFDNDVIIDTTKIVDSLIESVSIEELMALTNPGATLQIYGLGNVTFESGSTLDMNGTLIVGNDDGSILGTLNILDQQTITGVIDLVINGRDINGTSTVRLGDENIAGQNFVINSLAGNGDLITNSANLTINNSNNDALVFNGSFQIDGNLTLNGGSLLLAPESTAENPVISASSLALQGSAFSGILELLNGASMYLQPNEIFGSGLFIDTLTDFTLNLEGGLFGGNAQVTLGLGGANGAMNLNSGWLVGGDHLNGGGSLIISGNPVADPFNGFGGAVVFDFDMGLMANHNMFGDPRDPTQAFIQFTDVGFINFLPLTPVMFNFLPSNPDGLTLNELIETSQWLGTNTELIIFEGPGTNLDLTGVVGFTPETNLVTRSLDVFTDTALPEFFQLLATVGADYAAPAGGLSGIGQSMNDLITTANGDPSSEAAQMLLYLDYNASSLASYRQALSGMLPNSQFAAERITADNMYSNVTMRNIRELAIGTRGPGMIRAGQLQDPILLAALQEEDAVSGMNDTPDLLEPPKIIVQTSDTSKKDDDVFQALFAEGYGRWNDMDGVGFVAGYSARSVGVSGGWGVGLADGVTVGITAGWENTTATMKDNFGDSTVDSFRGTPFVSWSGSDGEIEKYIMLGVGGGYNTSNGTQNQKSGPFSTSYNFDMTGWEVDIEAAAGTRVPMSESFALQPEASIRYTILNYSGTNTDKTTNIETDYKGGDFQFVTGRLGFGMEWLLDPFSRVTASMGWQGQHLDYANAEFALPAAIGMTSQDGGSGSVNQFYVGTQLLFNPNWNTAISIGYEGAFGDGSSNAFTGSLILRF